MNIQEITSFLTVCKYSSFAKAAEVLYLTQPTVSWHISSLEKELDTKLFLRGRGKASVRLTPEGELFYPQAVKWEKLYSETQEALHAEKYEKYRFACVNSISNQAIPFLHNFFREIAPSCSLFLQMRPTPVIIHSVEQGELDSGIVCELPTSPTLKVTRLAYERMVFACRQDAPFPDHVNVEDLVRTNQINIHWTLAGDDWMNSHFRGKPYADVNSVYNLAPFFTHKEYWAIIPMSSFCSMDASRFRMCELNQTPPDRSFYLVSSATAQNNYFTYIKSALQVCLSQIDGLNLADE